MGLLKQQQQSLRAILQKKKPWNFENEVVILQARETETVQMLQGSSFLLVATKQKEKTAIFSSNGLLLWITY